MRIFVAAVSVLVIAACLVSGCGRREEVTRKIGDVTVTTKPGSSGEGEFKVETKEGSVSFSGNSEKRSIDEKELGLPVYPGATVQSEAKTTMDQNEVSQVTLTTPDDFSKVEAFYKSRLKGANSFSGNATGTQTAVFQIESEGGDTVVTLISNQGAPGTQISVVKEKK